MGIKVEKKKTPASDDEVISTFINSWKSVYGSEPTKPEIAMVWSQTALETGRYKSLYNYNVGNITTSGKEYNYYMNDDTHWDDKKNKWVGHVAKFRAYNSLVEGITDYLKFLKNGRFEPAMNASKMGDPKAFSQALAKVHYYDPKGEKHYSSNMSSLFNQFMKDKKFDTLFKNSLPSDTSNMENKPYMTQDLSVNNVLSILENLLKKITSSSETNFLIKISSDNTSSSIEFAKILCLALKEEANIQSSVHFKNDDVELSCHVNGNDPKELAKALEEFVSSIKDAFKTATAKFGSININSNVLINKTSNLEILDIKTANLHHRKFRLNLLKK